MSFYEIAKRTIRSKLDECRSLDIFIDEVKAVKGSGKIAFFPCSRLSREIIGRLKNHENELFSSILGCFDKSEHAKMDYNIPVYSLSELPGYLDDISVLIVPGNTYLQKELNHLQEFDLSHLSVLTYSQFENTIPEGGPSEVMERILRVFDFLKDEKSRATYLLTWMSKLLNDETVTHLFEMEEKLDLQPGSTHRYKNYVIEGMDDINCVKELYAELYRTRHVAPERGDVLFDIGGYKGDTAIYFADLVGDEGKVHVFEPIENNWKDIIKNVQQNNLSHIIEAVNLGCSNKTGVSSALSGPQGTAWAFIDESEDAQAIQTTTLDDYVREHDIQKLDFIKMDVEGLEMKVLEGARETIQRFRPKLAIALYHMTKDLVEIPEFIHDLAEYDMSIRCKMEGPYAVNLHCK